ncbi:MAG: cobalamin B12-binding domain-containing protein [Mycobacteriales bacterium]
MRVVLGKIGLDGHDVGLRLIAKRLIDAGAEVVYIGKRNTPEDFLAVAIDEDADAIGVGSLTGGLAALTIELADLLIAKEMSDVRLVAGGVVEPHEAQQLRARGIPVFGPSDGLDDVVQALLGSAATA